jgi:F420H(2)-dependent quinone reductase
MLLPVTAFFAPRVHRIDKALLRLTKGKFAACEILGWNMIQLTSIGAKTRESRIIPLIGMFDTGKIALIASNFGRERNPGWYYNLKAHPECEVQFNGQSGIYIAREVNGEEYERYWQLAVSYYAGYNKYKQRAMYRCIPVILLEPRES